ncbi:hypothetical protein GNI_193130 [Gregarina niphandrodes]|uniref:Uncharacterized protein n=1 Tax=Gregarina niphandrodes TaxID=110365 RepID=A0A023AWC4_GRENI|nr:hypothetical protein GNI_193130 [Gregarina niphandrodes]EZG43046.1 hypothetical protein GNI_193130 [Gregarina niphandrodes]|eukprot:XP_011133681.1 hypothetical protein GNI_193130 [Gregarina niphandrodes]
MKHHPVSHRTEWAPIVYSIRPQFCELKYKIVDTLVFEQIVMRTVFGVITYCHLVALFCKTVEYGGLTKTSSAIQDDNRFKLDNFWHVNGTKV